MTEAKRRIEFGDFQTPDDLALSVCLRLKACGITPDTVIEPTCGVGAFLLAAAKTFIGSPQLLGFEVNEVYIATLQQRLADLPHSKRVQLEIADFFATNWQIKLKPVHGSLLVIGNFPWVTNSVLGAMGGHNLPLKSNFLGFNGFEAISGKANFDISESMLLEVLRWFKSRTGDIAMLVKTAVARKVLAHAERQKEHVWDSFIVEIDAKKSFGAAVDACLLVMRLDPTIPSSYDYTVYDNLEARHGTRVGHRQGMTVGNLDTFETCAFLVGKSPQKWRSGIKHDASAVMEFTRQAGQYVNGFGESLSLEDTYLFPLLKGSDIGSHKAWRGKFILVTQRSVGESTDTIRVRAPKTWAYLRAHAQQLNARGSSIYLKNPQFSVFGVGDYSFQPWRIAICALYKNLRFRLVGPIEGRTVMFDDTVYYLSFENEDHAKEALEKLESAPATGLLSSLIFWDEKRPIKTSILNVLDWSKLGIQEQPMQAMLL